MESHPVTSVPLIYSDALPDSAPAALDEASEARVGEVSRRDQRSLRLEHVEDLVPGVP